MDIEYAKKQIIEALDRLQSDALSDAEEKLLQDPKALLGKLFEDVYMHVSGIGYKGQSGLEPLTCYLMDVYGDAPMLTFDPIADVIENITRDHLGTKASAEMIGRSIAALQSGIDRLKAYEARRNQAQS